MRFSDGGNAQNGLDSNEDNMGNELNLDIIKVQHDTHTIWKYYKCRMCSYRTKSLPLVHSHLNHHKQFWLTPFLCQYSRIEPHGCATNVLVVHKRGPRYGCNNCPFSTHSQLLLVSHATNCYYTTEVEHVRKYIEPQIHRCQSCTYTTAHKYRLNRHKRSRHPLKQKQYRCSQCSYIFPILRELTRHSRQHEDKSDTVVVSAVSYTQRCPLQNCKFRSDDEKDFSSHILQTHVSATTVVYYKCLLCLFVATEKNKLENHVAKDHVDPRLKMHKCDLCQFEFKQSMLKQHVLHEHIL